MGAFLRLFFSAAALLLVLHVADSDSGRESPDSGLNRNHAGMTLLKATGSSYQGLLSYFFAADKSKRDIGRLFRLYLPEELSESFIHVRKQEAASLYLSFKATLIKRQMHPHYIHAESERS